MHPRDLAERRTWPGGSPAPAARGGGDELVGRVLDGRYRIAARLGAGGMGTVYRAVQLSLGREVAIKVVNPALAGDAAIVQRFLREARLASHIQHPGAVAVIDFGQTADGQHYLVMELVRGRTLEAVLAAHGPMAPGRVVRIGMQVCDVLMSAHHLSIVHRDLKLANLMLVDDAVALDTVKVLDFGMARSLAEEPWDPDITLTGALVGTPAYMPPEVLQGRACDARSDLYSLGVILYELASGRAPYAGPSAAELIVQLATDEPTPPARAGIPDPLARVIARLIARDPDARHRDALELKVELARLAPAARHPPMGSASFTARPG